MEHTTHLGKVLSSPKRRLAPRKNAAPKSFDRAAAPVGDAGEPPSTDGELPLLCKAAKPQSSEIVEPLKGEAVAPPASEAAGPMTGRVSRHSGGIPSSCGEMEDERVLSLPALGRPFRLGMLYDIRSDNLIPGITLWDEITLQSKTTQQLQTSDFLVICSDSLADKASAMEVDASLRLSFLSGLVSVEGAGKYLENRQTSSHQERVTLQYKCTTRSESMTMEHLGQGRIQHPEVFDHGIATHVVTGLVYGAQAFFVFDKQDSLSSHERKVEGNLHAAIQKIPSIKINAEGELQLSEMEKKMTEEFACRFFGDFLLQKNPSCYSDAVKLYQELPNLLGAEGEKAMPVKVMLYPLSLIDTKASRLVRQISVNLLTDIEKYFEDLQEMKTACMDILKSDAVKRFHAIELQLQQFRDLTDICKRIIQEKMLVMLPRIRGGRNDEGCLAELLNNMSQSPLSLQALHSWLQTKHTQVKILNEYTRTLEDIKFASKPGDLESVIMSPENTYVLCFCMALPSNDSQLQTMKRCCHDKSLKNISKEAGHSVAPQQINSNSMAEAACVFKRFYDANKKKDKRAFIVSQEFSESDAFSARVICYKNGKTTSEDYELMSAPEGITEGNITHDSITISWNPPKYGAANVERYVVSCCAVKSYDVSWREEVPVVSTLCVDSDQTQACITGLGANTTYEVRVWARCEIGDGPVEEAIVTVKTRPASHPEELRILKISSNKILLKWKPPSIVAEGCTIQTYNIKEKQENKCWISKGFTTSQELSYSVKIAPGTVSSFKVEASCGPAGGTCASEICALDPAQRMTREELLQCLCTNSTPLATTPSIFVPDLKVASGNPVDMTEKLEFGESVLPLTERVIMLVGATGSGKTTLINGFVNYIFGVEWQDHLRFKMIVEPNVANQAMSQTTKITSYTLHRQEGFKIPYTLTIIDTPGFGDVSGIKRDKEITEIIRKFFTTGGANGISHIDAVGFVANSSLPRLTPTQRYIFDQILSLFGKDIADNIFLLLTFADGKKPQVLSGIKEAKVPYKKHFKFNNSALFARRSNQDEGNEDDSGEDGDRDFDSMFWEMGFKSFKLFLQELDRVESKSLVLTKNVLNERNRLEVYVSGIQRDIKQGLGTVDRLQREIDILETYQADIERNKNFQYEVEEQVYKLVEIPVGQHITNCLTCNRTCHENCGIPDDEDKKWCWAITDAYCRICPQKCHWSMHKNVPYKYELTVEKKTKTVSELRERYEVATQGKLTTEKLIEKVKEEFAELHLKVLRMTDDVRSCIQRLQEIALRPNPLTTVQYIEILLESEKSQAMPGWQARVEQLNIVKQEAEYVEEIADKRFVPFDKQLEEIEKKKSVKDWLFDKINAALGRNKKANSKAIVPYQ